MVLFWGMERRKLLIIGVFMCLFGLSSCREVKVEVIHKHLQNHGNHMMASYNHSLARILVQYASAANLSNLTKLFMWTCSRCNGLIKDFAMIELIVDVKHCLQAFVGFAPDLNAIVIAFRGTNEKSIQNWMEDMFWKQIEIDYPGVDGAKVHHGFYSAYHETSLRPSIVSAVKKVKQLYGDIKVVVIGHSMGGAMAAFCGLDLHLSQEEQNIEVMTFGQPRIGNAVFASYYSQKVPNTIRVTHGHDIVPHLPPYYYYFPQKTYHHFPREVWIHKIGFGIFSFNVDRVCDGSGEDPTCSRSVPGDSISDHLVYYGVQMKCDDDGGLQGACKVVMDSVIAEYGTFDPDGNLVLCKNLSMPTSGTRHGKTLAAASS